MDGSWPHEGKHGSRPRSGQTGIASTLRRTDCRKTPASSQDLAQNADLQDIIGLNLQRAVQLSVDLASHLIGDTDISPPSTIAEHFDALNRLQVISPALADRMKKAVGFRNLAVHSYQAIDWNIVYQICSRHLDDFRQFAKAVETRCSAP
ncbi:MAG: DUF86 domain-containing protein [Nitrospira sp.]|nr:DUF86 domain-containing protein [Nitrospira sp.]